MKKRFLTLVLSGILVFSPSIVSFAGQWQQDTTGWFYQNDDGSYLNNGWNWVEGKCYYFTPEGYCLVNTTTPDGYQVDANGAWIIDGVVQTQTDSTQPSVDQQQNSVQIDTLLFAPPAGYSLIASDGNIYAFEDQSGSVLTVISSYPATLPTDPAQQEQLLDSRILTFGTPLSKTVKEYNSGAWYYYTFPAETKSNVQMNTIACTRIQGDRLQLVTITAFNQLSESGVDDIMNPTRPSAPSGNVVLRGHLAYTYKTTLYCLISLYQTLISKSSNSFDLNRNITYC